MQVKLEEAFLKQQMELARQEEKEEQEQIHQALKGVKKQLKHQPRRAQTNQNLFNT